MKNLKFIASVLLILPLISCSSGGGSSSGGGGTSPGGLTLTAPVAYPLSSGTTQLPTNVYFTVTNTSNTAAAVTYSFPTSANTSGATVSGPSSCQSVQPNASCTGFIQVSGGNTGAISLQVSGATSANSSLSKIKSLFGISSVEDGAAATVGLTQLPSSIASGADGINLLYPSKVIASSSGSTVVDIVAVVNSPNAGAFNEIRLVNQSGNELNYKVLSNNSGQGLTNLSLGSVVTLQLTIPSSASSFNFYVQTVENGTPVSTISAPDLIILLPSGVANPIIQAVPEYSKQLNSQQATQVITYTNIGNATASNITESTGSLLSIESNLCSTSLAPGSSCDVTVAFDASQDVGSGVAQVSMNYGTSPNVQTAISNIQYQGASTPNYGISVSAGGSGFVFNANTNNGVVSKTVTLTNTGSTVENNFVLTLPTYFSVAVATGASPCIISGSTITSSLVAGGQCTFTLTYTNASVISQSMANLGISYTYNNAQTAQTSVPLTYQTTLAQASLQISASSVNFGAISNDGTQSESQGITISNHGTAAALNISLSISNTPLFSTAATTCGSSLSAGGSCIYTLQFGPESGGVGIESATASLTYLPSSGASSITESLGLTGTLLAPGTANINATTSVSGFAGGDGESPSTAYQIESGGAATISVTYTNTGDSPAESFYTQYNALLPIQGNFWTDISHGCSESLDITLEPNNSSSACADTVGTANLPVNKYTIMGSDIWMSWTDQAGYYPNRTPNFPPVYVNVYTPASILYQINNTQNESTFSPGATFTITATLQNGYQVPATTVTAGTLPTGITLNQNTCQVSSTSNTCSFVATVGNNATSGNYSINFSNDGNITQTNNSVNFNINEGAYLVVAYSSNNTQAVVYDTLTESMINQSTISAGLSTSLSIDSSTNTLYAGNKGYGYVYRISNFNTSTPIITDNVNSPLTGGVTSIFAANNILYAGTVSGYVYALSNANTADINGLINTESRPGSDGVYALTYSSASTSLYAGIWTDTDGGSGKIYASEYFPLNFTEITSSITSGPRYAAADTNGHVYFAVNGSLYRIDETTGHVTEFGQPNPITGMVLSNDGSTLYVAQNDSSGRGICVFTNPSTLPTKSGYYCPTKYAFPSGESSTPTYLAIDRNNTLYVAFSDNSVWSYASPNGVQLNYANTGQTISGMTAY